MDEEIWKPVPSYPGVKASSWGRILLPPTTVRMPRGGTRVYTPKPTLGVVTKSKKETTRTYRGLMNKKHLGGNVKIHQLVCEAFHGPRPFDAAEVVFKDEDQLNTRPENLRWGTRKENANASGYLQYCRHRTGVFNPHVKGRPSLRLAWAHKNGA